MAIMVFECTDEARWWPSFFLLSRLEGLEYSIRSRHLGICCFSTGCIICGVMCTLIAPDG